MHMSTSQDRVDEDPMYALDSWKKITINISVQIIVVL